MVTSKNQKQLSFEYDFSNRQSINLTNFVKVQVKRSYFTTSQMIIYLIKNDWEITSTNLNLHALKPEGGCPVCSREVPNICECVSAATTSNKI